jgi:hypothetical protein
MQTVYIGNTLVNDVMLGAQRMDDVLQAKSALNIEYLVVAAGGQGAQGQSGNSRGAGGGGAGGLLSGSATLLPGQTYYIQVGGYYPQFPTNDNGDSYLTGSNFYQYSLQGGNGGGGSSGPGGNGGSGGGGARCTTFSCTTGAGSGTVGQGNNGAGGTFSNPGSGGGANSAASGTTPGTGKASSISGASVTYSTGGTAAAGGSDGAAETGNGGNGGQYVGSTTGRFGGSGIIYIRYRGPQAFTGGTVTTDGDFTVHKFNTTADLGTGAGSQKTNYTIVYQ